MDPLIVKETIEALVQLYQGNNLPKSDFSLGQIEGLLAEKQGVDVSQKQLTVAFGALGVERTSQRAWSHQSLRAALRRAAQAPALSGKGPGVTAAATA